MRVSPKRQDSCPATPNLVDAVAGVAQGTTELLNAGDREVTTNGLPAQRRTPQAQRAANLRDVILGASRAAIGDEMTLN